MTRNKEDIFAGRRNFIKHAISAGAASLVVPHMIPRHVLGGENRAAANNRVVIGVIGVGAMGSGLTRHFSFIEDVDVAAVADVDRNKAESVAGPMGIDSYQDYRHILDRKDIDAVVITTPEHWHALPAIHAAQAGKDIYCEKPISLTVREGRMMVEAVRKHKRVFQTGSQDRSALAAWLACMCIRNGRLGKIKRVIAYNHPSPYYNGLPGHAEPDDLDWDMYCGPVQPHPYHPQFRGVRGWVEFRDFAGHSMTSNGSHGFDQIQRALGMDESGPSEVWTEGNPYAPPIYRGGGKPNTRSPKVFMRYPGDITVELADAHLFGARFIGENGTVDLRRREYTFDPVELGPERISEDALDNEDLSIQLYRSRNHHRNWLDCIKNREETVATAEIGHRSATVCHLGNIARWVSQVTGETGQRLAWDAQKETFSNSDWANHFLDRPRRKPYQLPDTL